MRVLTTTSPAPDVLLADVDMPGLSGLDLARRTALPTVLMSNHSPTPWLSDALALGRVSFIAKDAPPSSLADAVIAAAAGRFTVDIPPSPALASTAPTSPTPASPDPATSPFFTAESLTDSELEVLHLLCQGLSNKAIADATFRSEATVKRLVSSLLDKAGVSSRLELGIAAIRAGLVD